ncbi:hypothetical protein CVT26_006471 [Gymnopilus dilepis]|uniref:Uncharacterized protein n=1 Tax=Gymnopilus dilepis TaxID=231916 RepID=A0A409YTV3_9AGAR|nr:hypothetical protein CVT26_006471 [Gymnopilus dilepis]
MPHRLPSSLSVENENPRARFMAFPSQLVSAGSSSNLSGSRKDAYLKLSGSPTLPLSRRNTTLPCPSALWRRGCLGPPECGPSSQAPTSFVSSHLKLVRFKFEPHHLVAPSQRSPLLLHYHDVQSASLNSTDQGVDG